MALPIRFKLWMLKLAAKGFGGLFIYCLIHGMMIATRVIPVKTPYAIGYMFLAIIASLLMPAPLKILGRFVFFFTAFILTYVASFYALKLLGHTVPMGLTEGHKIYLGVSFGIPTVLTLCFYQRTIDALLALTGSAIRAVGRVLAAPFKAVAKISFVKSLLAKIKRKPSLDIDLSIQQIDALGNGDTYMKGRLFEEYVARVYQCLNLAAMTTTEMRHRGMLPASIQKRGGSGEQGVDVVVERKYANGSVRRLIVQCKHYSKKVDNSAIQQIVTAMKMYQADEAAVITNNYYTEPARELAESHGVTLIDRDSLPELIALAIKTYEDTRKN